MSEWLTFSLTNTIRRDHIEDYILVVLQENLFSQLNVKRLVKKVN
ncbi:hypothetical protein [Fusibacter sp. JL216-2]